MGGDRFKDVRKHLGKARGHLAGAKPAADTAIDRITKVGHQIDPNHSEWIGAADLARDELERILVAVRKLTHTRKATATGMGKRLTQTGKKELMPGVDEAITSLNAAVNLLAKMPEIG
jgi:hypothetical protein